jgi:hypothetical protein
MITVLAFLGDRPVEIGPHQVDIDEYVLDERQLNSRELKDVLQCKQARDRER